MAAHDQIDLLAQIGVAVLLFVVGLKLDLNHIHHIGAVALTFSSTTIIIVIVKLLSAFEVPFEGKLKLAGVDTLTIEHYRSQANASARQQLDTLASSPATGMPASWKTTPDSASSSRSKTATWWCQENTASPPPKSCFWAA